MFVRYSIFVIALFLNAIAFAQPVPPSVGYPLALSRGGSQISNVVTTVSTSSTINAQAIATGNLEFTSASAITLNGIAAPSPAANIRIWIYNRSSSGFAITNESGSATAANRIRTPSAASIIYLPTQTGVSLYYSTSLSRWVVQEDIPTYSSPLSKSASGVVSMTQVSASNSGYLTSTIYNSIIAGLQWLARANDIYNTNSGNVWIALYPCAELTTYTTCAAYTQCTVNRTAACSGFGDQSSCEGVDGGGCTWDGGVGPCSGTYFQSGDCSGNYNRDDTSQSKLQVKATSQCTGTATACSSYVGNEAGCNGQDGCGAYVASTCSAQGDQGSCEAASCSWGGANCSGDNSQPNTCPNYNNDSMACSGAGCTYNDIGCSAYNGDEGGCNGAGADCTWNSGSSECWVACQGDNSTANSCPGIGDQSSCEGASCTWTPDSCSGDNSSCPGTATACSTYTTSGGCGGQAGCSYLLTPALRAQGDNITTSDGYLQFLKTSAGAPTGSDCDNDSEYGRLAIDTTNERLYVCNGASRGWDYLALQP